MLVREIALDRPDENGICRTNGIGLSQNDGYYPSYAFERNNRLFVMSSIYAKGECFERDLEKADEWKKTSFKLDVTDESAESIFLQDYRERKVHFCAEQHLQ